MILKKWLISAPKNIVYRVNTILSDSKQITNCIENELHCQNKTKGHCRKLPTIKLFEKIPELIVVNCWNDEINLNLEIQSKEIIVDVKCGEAVIRGADIFAPGVIGMPHGLNVGETVSVFADIVKDCKKGLVKKYADENKFFLGNGIIQLTRDDLFGHEIKNVSGIAVKLIDVVSRLPQLNDKNFEIGSCLLQNLPSIICSRILDPQPGEIVLDMCAAPGHKTTHISALMKNKGTLIALEKNKNKLQGLKKHCENFNANQVHCFCFDSTKALINVDEKRQISQGPPFLKETFDRILLDGPCSALGQRPQFFNTITISQLNSHVFLQKNLFFTAVELLKSGGTLVYSTCTITLAENEEIVAWALKKFPILKLQSIKNKISQMNILNYGTTGFNIDGLTIEESDSLLRFGPESDCIGFFIACFTKKETQ
ncbi:tRNA (cytosine(72)-C(5))-methyltransferase NSUN6 isoform X2 [Leptopilina boulardi]|nr:tRNA (cytosine(72)-C(5))-methyltransferase NSUN6 isoform X2 [Leptopilina boulardi]